MDTFDNQYGYGREMAPAAAPPAETQAPKKSNTVAWIVAVLIIVLVVGLIAWLIWRPVTDPLTYNLEVRMTDTEALPGIRADLDYVARVDGVIVPATAKTVSSNRAAYSFTLQGIKRPETVDLDLLTPEGRSMSLSKITLTDSTGAEYTSSKAVPVFGWDDDEEEWDEVEAMLVPGQYRFSLTGLAKA